MTVRELIEALQKHDPSAKVIQDNGLSSGYLDIERVDARTIAPASYADDIYDDAEPLIDAIPAVWIG